MTTSALTSASDQVILAQIAALAAQGESGLSQLLGLFQHRSWAVRRGVVAALASADTASIKRLTDVLARERAHEPTIAGIVDALCAAPPSADALMRTLLSASAVAVLCDGAQIVGRRRDRAAVPRLIELSEHVDDNVVLAAIEALGRIGGVEATERLLALAGGNNFFRAFPAIQVLGVARETRAVPLLRNLLQNPLYAPEAARALGRIGNGPAADALVATLGHAPDSLLPIVAAGLVAIQNAGEPSSSTHSAVNRAVRQHGGAALRARVMRALALASGDDAVTLGRLLIWLADEESVADFLPLLGSSDEMSDLAVEGLRRLSALEDPRVLSVLETGSSEVRARLLPALSGVSAAAHAVARCLDDEQANIRAMACHALARGRATAEVPRLFRMLADDDLGVVHAAVSAIQSLGSQETETLALATVRDAVGGARQAALRIAMYFGYPSSLKLALSAIDSDDERLREIALSGLPALEDPSATEALLGATRHSSARTRASAVRALGQVARSEEVKTVLIERLADSDAWVRYYACQSLGKLQATAALAHIVGRLDDPAEQVKMAAVEALALLTGDAAAQALLHAADSDNPEVRRAALVGMGTRRDTRHRAALEQAVRSSDQATRLVALSSLAQFPETEAELERVASDDTNAGVRKAAVELLATRDDVRATSALVRLLKRDPERPETQAALAQHLEQRLPTLLGMLGDAEPALAAALVALVVRCESPACRAALDVAFESDNAFVRRAVARALSGIWDDAAKANLARAATLDADAQVRQICAAALA